MEAVKTLKDYSELEKLTISDEEFEAALEASVEELIESMEQAGRDLSVSWREREPEAAARLDQWEVDNPEAAAAKERAGVSIRQQAKDSAIGSMGGHWREKRAKFRDLATGATLPTVASALSPDHRVKQSVEQGHEL